MQDNSLTAKVALVTGGARRIGADIAKTLHAQGMNVVLHYNASGALAQKLCDELNRQRANSAVTVQAELLGRADEKMLVERALDTWGRLDVLVNNASRFYRTAVGDVNDANWEDLINSNVKAPFFLAQAAAPSLAKYKGVIINITDIHAESPLRDYSVYCISKAALLMATKSLAKELAPDVRVNAVAPGAIAWPEGENSLDAVEKQRIIDKTLLKRSGGPQDIAKAVLYFVRDANFVTGQVLNVDGGRSAG